MRSPLKLLAPRQHPADKTQDAINYLNAHNPVVRVGFSNCPNMGHQTATLESARRLRQLGYNGTFEVVYDGPAARAKLTTLLPSLTHGASSEQAKIDLVDNAHAQAHRRQVALVCGSETPEEVHQQLNTQVALVLQPLQWPMPRGIAGPRRFQPLVRLPKDSALWMEPPLPASVSLPLFMKGPQLETLLALTQQQQDGSIDLQLLYSAYRAACSTREALRLLTTAVLRAQEDTGAPHPVRPTVLLLVQSLETADKGAGIPTEAPNAMEQASTQLRAEGVAVMTSGPLPEPVFRSLFAQSSLPPMLEGANTTNLMRRLQKPYLSFQTFCTPFPERQPGDPQARQAEAATRAFNFPRREESIQALTDALLGARRPGPFRDYFTEIGARSHDPRNDQLALGLQALHASLVPRWRATL